MSKPQTIPVSQTLYILSVPTAPDAYPLRAGKYYKLFKKDSSLVERFNPEVQIFQGSVLTSLMRSMLVHRDSRRNQTFRLRFRSAECGHGL